jgi:26S proteasome regulatory subunit N8
MTADNAIEESTPTPKSVIANPQPQTVVVHPLVLLSVVDHYSRSAKNTRKRVLGILLGQHATKANQYTVNVANSFAGKIL